MGNNLSPCCEKIMYHSSIFDKIICSGCSHVINKIGYSYEKTLIHIDDLYDCQDPDGVIAKMNNPGLKNMLVSIWRAMIDIGIRKFNCKICKQPETILKNRNNDICLDCYNKVIQNKETPKKNYSNLLDEVNKATGGD